MITELLAKTVMKMIAKQFKLDKILAYVEDPNDADKRIDELELDVFSLKQNTKRLNDIAHEPKDFVCCVKCNCCSKCNKKTKGKKKK